jgi:hypothetical protein
MGVCSSRNASVDRARTIVVGYDAHTDAHSRVAPTDTPSHDAHTDTQSPDAVISKIDSSCNAVLAPPHRRVASSNDDTLATNVEPACVPAFNQRDCYERSDSELRAFIAQCTTQVSSANSSTSTTAEEVARALAVKISAAVDSVHEAAAAACDKVRTAAAAALQAEDNSAVDAERDELIGAIGIAESNKAAALETEMVVADAVLERAMRVCSAAAAAAADAATPHAVLVEHVQELSTLMELVSALPGGPVEIPVIDVVPMDGHVCGSLFAPSPISVVNLSLPSYFPRRVCIGKAFEVRGMKWSERAKASCYLIHLMYQQSCKHFALSFSVLLYPFTP